MMFNDKKTQLLLSVFFLQWAIVVTQHSVYAVDSKLEMNSHCIKTSDQIRAKPLLMDLVLCDSDRDGGDESLEMNFHCLKSNLKRYQSIEDPSCKDYFRPKIRSLHFGNLKHRIKNLSSQTPQTPAHSPGDSLMFEPLSLAKALDHIQMWATQLTPLYRELGGDEWIKDVTDLHQRLWDRIWSHLNRSEGNSLEREKLFIQQLSVFSQILTGFSERQIPFELFFQFLDQSVGQFYSKIELLTRLTEMACPFSSCGNPQGQSLSEIEVMNRLFLRLSALETAQPEANQELLRQISTPEIRTFLKAWMHAQVLLELQPHPSQGEKYWNRLNWIVQRAKEFDQRVRNETPPTLKVRLHQQNILKAPDELDQLLRELHDSRTEFERSRERLFQSLIQTQNGRVQFNPLQNQLRNETQELQKAQRELQAVDVKIEQGRGTFAAQRIGSLEEWTGSQDWKDRWNHEFVTAAQETFDLKGSQSRFTPSGRSSVTVENLAVGVAQGAIQAREGQVLEFSVQGTWSPLYALAQKIKPSELQGAKIGPEGFIQILSQSRTEMKSQTEGSSERTYHRTDQASVDSTGTGSEERSGHTENQTDFNRTTRSEQKSKSETSTNSTGSRTTDSVSDHEGLDFSARVGVRAGIRADVGTPGIVKSLSGVGCEAYIDTYLEVSGGYSRGRNSSNTRDAYSASDCSKAQTQQSSQSKDQGRSVDHVQSQSSTSLSSRSQTTNQTQSEGKDRDHTSTHQKGKSNEDRNTVSFTRALHSEFTPFPQMPVGSLLLVQVKKGMTQTLLNSDSIVSIEPIYNHFKKSIKKEADFYLVINDMQPPGVLLQSWVQSLALGEESLHVEYALKKSFTEMATELYQKIEPILAGIQTRSQTDLETGTLTPTQQKAIQLQTLELMATQGARIHDVPPMAERVEGWIQQELAYLDLRSRKGEFENKIAILTRNVERLTRDLALLENGNQLSAQQKLWSLNQHDVDYFGERLLSVFTTLQETLLPILQVRYPEVFDDIQTRETQSFFSSFHPGSSLSDLAKKTERFLTSLKDHLHTRSKGARFGEKVLVIRFPKATQGQFECNELDDSCPKTSAVLASRVWSALESAMESAISNPESEAASLATFQIRPEDLYVGDVTDLGSGKKETPVHSGSLCSHQSCPVIEKMAIYFKTNGYNDLSEKINRQRPEINIHLVSDLVFPDRLLKKEVTFKRKDPDSSLPLSVPLFFGEEANPIELFHQIETAWTSSEAGGLSPWGEFTLHFKNENLVHGNQALSELIRSSDEIALVFKVTYRVSQKE